MIHQHGVVKFSDELKATEDGYGIYLLLQYAVNDFLCIYKIGLQALRARIRICY